MPPFFFGYGEKEIARYYTELAEAANLPLIMYCSPLSGVNITYDMVGRFMDIPHAIGVKWTSYDYYTMHRIKELRGGDVNVLNGPDECLLCGLTMGADGGIGATYNVMPGVFRAIYDHFKAGELEAARRAQYKANRLIEVIIRFGVQASLKEMLARQGFDCGYCVYPQKRLTEEGARACSPPWTRWTMRGNTCAEALFPDPRIPTGPNIPSGPATTAAGYKIEGGRQL